MTFYNLEHLSEEAFPGKSFVDCMFLKLNSNYQDKLITPLSFLLMWELAEVCMKDLDPKCLEKVLHRDQNS